MEHTKGCHKDEHVGHEKMGQFEPYRGEEGDGGESDTHGNDQGYGET
jgi:hypothetical protein